MTQQVQLDPYLVDTLMRDLVGHDRAPSAYLVYLWLWRRTHGEGRAQIGASLQTLATQTGLSKSAVQNAVRHLKQRKLIAASRSHATEAPTYQVLQPWRRYSDVSSPAPAATSWK
jgi:Helix-turn-helix domain